MCRNITELGGLEPPTTPDAITAAAEQYVRKVSGIRTRSPALAATMAEAVSEIAEVTARLFEQVPPRCQPPATVPPLRRPEVRARLGIAPIGAHHDR